VFSGRMSQSQSLPAMNAIPTRLGYSAPTITPDESVDATGASRPHWHTFFRSANEIGPNELARRWREAQHIIRENGVTYNVYGDPRGIARPWQLDPIPLLISPTDAEAIEFGLIQRGLLLEKILADIYGEQKLLKEGLLPPELVFGNPGFWRPCHHITLPGNRFLHLYAANLGRTADGTFRVMGDRTQAPSGAGYALENRIVMSRTLPEPFRDCRVQRLAMFFRTFRDTLREIAPRRKDNPRIVLLTPGPLNETYFEHAYLARYLGITLVEGGDLTVRDNRVFMKVLGGLQPIDVIFRRLDDDFCDPLELRPDSFLGVPGLVSAVRAGNVAVANALGTGVLETPALLAYLPQICRRYFQEDLRLDSVKTWWCGQPDSLRYVLEHFDDMVLKPAFLASRVEPVIAAELSIEAKAKWIARLKARPRDYVGQERLSLSTAPVMIDGKLQPRRVVLRTYLAAHGDTFAAMPGGLTRVSGADGAAIVTMQQGGGSKDTWVLSAGAVNTFSLLPPTNQPVELTRAGGDLPSRAADNLFWLGRYAERAEGTMRLMRGIFVRLTERAGLADVPELPALLRTLTIHCDVYPGFVGDGAEARLANPEPEVMANVFDLTRPGSVAAVLITLRRVAGSVRDRISMDMWRALHDLSRFPTDPATQFGEDGPTLSDVLDLLNRTIITLAAFGGMAVESMTRTEGWRFLDMGRKLERAFHMGNLLKGTLITPTAQEGSVLDAILEVADSSMTYRRRYMGSLRVEPVLDLLVFDESNPRSLSSQLVQLVEDVDHLPRPSHRAARGIEQRLSLQCLSQVRLAEVDRLALVERGQRPILKKLVEEIVVALPTLSEAITQQYLTHLQTSRHLSGA
jgi:uncharacterized circularly permuted ATP-grasp superfamily protein/uncharacterized alpha-E superfamily protein